MKHLTKIFLSVIVAGALILPVFCLASTEIQINDFVFTQMGSGEVVYDFGSSIFILSSFYPYNCSDLVSIALPGASANCDVGTFNYQVLTGELVATPNTDGTASIILSGYYVAGKAGAAGGGLFTLPGNAISSILATISDVINDIGPFVWLAIGIPLSFYVVKKWLALMP